MQPNKTFFATVYRHQINHTNDTNSVLDSSLITDSDIKKIVIGTGIVVVTLSIVMVYLIWTSDDLEQE